MVATESRFAELDNGRPIRYWEGDKLQEIPPELWDLFTLLAVTRDPTAHLQRVLWSAEQIGKDYLDSYFEALRTKGGEGGRLRLDPVYYQIINEAFQGLIEILPKPGDNYRQAETYAKLALNPELSTWERVAYGFGTLGHAILTVTDVANIADEIIPIDLFPKRSFFSNTAVQKFRQKTKHMDALLKKLRRRLKSSRLGAVQKQRIEKVIKHLTKARKVAAKLDAVPLVQAIKPITDLPINPTLYQKATKAIIGEPGTPKSTSRRLGVVKRYESKTKVVETFVLEDLKGYDEKDDNDFYILPDREPGASPPRSGLQAYAHEHMRDPSGPELGRQYWQSVLSRLCAGEPVGDYVQIVDTTSGVYKIVDMRPGKEGELVNEGTLRPEPERPKPEMAAGELVGRGPRETTKWAIGALLAAILLCWNCLAGGSLIFGGWKAWERFQRPEPAARVAPMTVTPVPQQVEKEAEKQATLIHEVVPTKVVEVQGTRETVEPPPEQEEVVPPTHTPTPTRTPTITPTPTEALPSGPEERVFVAEDGQELVGTYYPPPACPSPLTIVYFPWVRGDKEDVREIIDLIPGDLSYGIFAITPRGCEGGCQEWNPSAWLLDYQAAMEAAKGLPCAGQGPIVTFGSSVGADGAIVACAREARCVGAFAVSPGGYTDEFTYADEVAIAVERGKPVWSVVSEDDPESARLDRPGLGDGYREIVIPGGDHGNELHDERTAQVIQDFVECATSAFASPRCLEALAEDHLAKGNAHLEQVKDDYTEHDCEHWIPGAEQAIRECTTAIKLNPDSAGAYFCRALGNTYLEEPVKAIDDLERALKLGLTGKEKSDAQELLKGLKEGVAAPACSIGPLFFTEGWTESGSPLNLSETCSEDITNEIRATWELYGSCDQWMTVEWYYNGRLTCFYSYKPEEDGPWEGTVYYTDDGKDLFPGTWEARVFVGVKEIGSASCDIPWPAVEPPIPATLSLAFNTAQPPFDVPSVRRALAMAIDREALLDLLGREDKLPARGLVPPSLWADERYYGQADVPFDPKRARALLGREFPNAWSVGVQIAHNTSEGHKMIAEFIQAQWKEHLGIEVDLTVVEEDAYAEGLEALSPHAFFAGWLVDYPSPDNFVGGSIQEISKLTKWSNAEYDRLVEQAFQEASQNRRMELYSKAERILCETDAAIVPLYHYIHVWD